MHCSCDPGEPAREALDEIVRLVRIAVCQLIDDAFRLRICQVRIPDERHRMHLDVVADDELHAGKPYTVGRQGPPARCRSRIRQVQHDLGTGRRDGGEIQVLDRDVGCALIDMALFALRARYGDLLLTVEHLRCIAGADNGRQPEFAADDRVSVSIENIIRAPPRSARTIFCTPIDSATCR